MDVCSTPRLSPDPNPTILTRVLQNGVYRELEIAIAK